MFELGLCNTVPTSLFGGYVQGYNTSTSLIGMLHKKFTDESTSIWLKMLTKDKSFTR